MNRLVFVLFFLGLVAGITFYALNQKSKPANKKALLIPNNVDYYLSNTKQKSFKTDGSIDFTLNSSLLEHFKREDESRLLEPDVKVRRDNTWQIKAGLGNFFHPEEIITFKQNVRLDKLSQTAAFKVLANDLLLNIKQGLVISKSSVKVSADSWNLNAKTMTLNINTEVHQFSQVTARYRHDKNS